MDPKLEERLIAIEREVAETKKIVLRMRRVQRNANAFKLLYWLVIVGIGIAAIYAIKPYIQAIKGVYGGTSGDGNKFNVESLIDEYNTFQSEN